MEEFKKTIANVLEITKSILEKKISKDRDYKKEYRDFHGKPGQVKNRSDRNKARTDMGLKKGDGKEVDHKNPLSSGGSNNKRNLRAVSRETNREKGAK